MTTTMGASTRVHRVAPRPRVDPERARCVAAAFLAAPREPTGRLVRAAYADLALQSSRLYAWLTADRGPRQVRVAYTQIDEPYASAEELSESVRVHRRLELSPARLDRDRRHPLLDSSVGGAFDRLRAVHDIISHGWHRFGFDRDGEYGAWLFEDRLYTGLARHALATELHGQHSVRWSSGQLADHKAVLLDRAILSASKQAART